MAYAKHAIPKGQRQAKGATIYHYIHTAPEEERQARWTEDYFQVVSIDPSTKNLGIRCEKRYHDGTIENLVHERFGFIPTAAERRAQGLAPLERPNDIELFPTLFRDISNYLDQYLEIYLHAHIIIIERQLDDNYKCVRVGQHVISYFQLHLKDRPLLPVLVELDSKIKFTQFKCPGLDTKGKKNWLILRMIRLCRYRNDQASLDKFLECKKDDLSDTIAQIEVWFKLAGLPSVFDIPNINEILDSIDIDDILNPPKKTRAKAKAKPKIPPVVVPVIPDVRPVPRPRLVVEKKDSSTEKDETKRTSAVQQREKSAALKKLLTEPPITPPKKSRLKITREL